MKNLTPKAEALARFIIQDVMLPCGPNAFASSPIRTASIPTLFRHVRRIMRDNAGAGPQRYHTNWRACMVQSAVAASVPIITRSEYQVHARDHRGRVALVTVGGQLVQEAK